MTKSKINKEEVVKLLKKEIPELNKYHPKYHFDGGNKEFTIIFPRLPSEKITTHPINVDLVGKTIEQIVDELIPLTKWYIKEYRNQSTT